MGGPTGFILHREPAEGRAGLSMDRLEILFPRAPRLFQALLGYWWRTAQVRRLQRILS